MINSDAKFALRTPLVLLQENHRADNVTGRVTKPVVVQASSGCLRAAPSTPARFCPTPMPTPPLALPLPKAQGWDPLSNTFGLPADGLGELSPTTPSPRAARPWPGSPPAQNPPETKTRAGVPLFGVESMLSVTTSRDGIAGEVRSRRSGADGAPHRRCSRPNPPKTRPKPAHAAAAGVAHRRLRGKRAGPPEPELQRIHRRRRHAARGVARAARAPAAAPRASRPRHRGSRAGRVL